MSDPNAGDMADKMKAVLEDLRALPVSRERSLAITKIEECAYWAALALEGITSPIDRALGPPKPAGVKS